MEVFKGKKVVGQLEKRKGGYFFISLSGSSVNKFPDKARTRLICTIENHVSFQCGLNHLGDGDFFIILSKRNVELAGKGVGQKISVTIELDPDPLGVAMPESIEALLSQDSNLKKIFDGLTAGRKRNIIHTVSRIRDIDKQIARAVKMLEEQVTQK